MTGNDEIERMTQQSGTLDDHTGLNRLQSVSLLLANITAVSWFVIQSIMAIRPGLIATVQQRVIHLGFALVLAFLIAAWKSPRRPLAITNLVLAAAGGAVQVFAYFEVYKQQFFLGLYTTESIVVAVIGLLILFYATYAAFGWALPILGTLFIAWALFGSELPGVLHVPSVPWERLIPSTYFSGEGVHGVPLDASTRYIFMFIVFGSFFVEFGATTFLLRLVQRMFKRTRGAAGKMAVFGSLLFGVVSDSTTANVATTGVITIPAMQRSGFSREESAAIESAASVGGQVMPPVMGTVAFLMVALTGIPYAEIALAALLPALLYYFSLFVAVDRMAARRGLGAADLVFPKIRASEWTWNSIIFGTPLGVLLYLLLILRWEPSESVTWALALLVILYAVRHPNRDTARRCLHAAIKGARRSVIVAIVTAVVGTLIGPIFMSGLGLRLTSIFLDVAGASVWILLIMTMLASFILGSGLPSSATYILLAILVAPSLSEFGLPLLAVHMFIMYFGVLSDISPPTMATVFVASGIAESKPFRTAMIAMGLAIAGFIVPFLFHTHPGILLRGDGFLEDAGDILFAVAVVLSIGAAINGWILRQLNVLERILFALGAITLIAPYDGTMALGAAVIAVALVAHLGRNRRALAAAVTSADNAVVDRQPSAEGVPAQPATTPGRHEGSSQSRNQ